jgi:threonine/homoserine/homoserine lactone efflux protein
LDPLPLLGSLLTGALFAWSLAAIPGPGNALIAHEAARRGMLAGITTGLGAITADLVMFLLMWFGVLPIVERFPLVQVAMGVVGTVVLVRFAWDAYRAARSPARVEGAARGSFARSFVAIVSSPLNHVWWLTAGATFLRENGAVAMGGFFAALLAWVAAWSWLARLGAARVRRFAELVGYASAAILLVFAIVLAVATLRMAALLA